MSSAYCIVLRAVLFEWTVVCTVLYPTPDIDFKTLKNKKFRKDATGCGHRWDVTVYIRIAMEVNQRWKKSSVNPRTFSYHPPPGSLGFRVIFAARIFWGFHWALPGRKIGGFSLFLLIARYFWLFWLSQQLLVAILIISHCSQPAETNNQVQLIVVLGCVDIDRSVVFTVLVNLTNTLAWRFYCTSIGTRLIDTFAALLVHAAICTVL